MFVSWILLFSDKTFFLKHSLLNRSLPNHSLLNQNHSLPNQFLKFFVTVLASDIRMYWIDSRRLYSLSVFLFCGACRSEYLALIRPGPADQGKTVFSCHIHRFFCGNRLWNQDRYARCYNFFNHIHRNPSWCKDHAFWKWQLVEQSIPRRLIKRIMSANIFAYIKCFSRACQNAQMTSAGQAVDPFFPSKFFRKFKYPFRFPFVL